MPVKGGYLLMAGAGSLLVWSGFKGKSWSTVIRDILAGKHPQTTTTAFPITPGTAQAGGSGGGPGAVPVPSGSVLTRAAIKTLWLSVGGSPAAANNAVCHAIQESGGRVTVTSSNPDGGINVGLWQLDTKGVGAGHSETALKNPVLNARLTVKATGNGRNWSAWSTPGC